jgi:hypothetical protein
LAKLFRELKFSYKEIIQDLNKFNLTKAPRELTKFVSTYLPLHKSPLVGGGTDSAAKQLTSLEHIKDYNTSYVCKIFSETNASKISGPKITSQRNIAVHYAFSTYGNYFFSRCSLWPRGQMFVLRSTIQAMES